MYQIYHAGMISYTLPHCHGRLRQISVYWHHRYHFNHGRSERKVQMKTKSLQSSMLLLFIISIMIPFFFVSTIFSFYYSQQLLRNNETNVSNTLTSISAGIGIYVSELDSISNLPYYYTNILDTMQMINTEYSSDSKTSLEQLQSEKEYRVAFIKQIYNATQTVSAVMFYPESNPGNLVYIISRNTSTTRVDIDDGYKSTDWYAALKDKERKPVFSPSYETINNAKTLISFSYIENIWNVDTRKNIGIIKIVIPADNLISLLKNVEISDHSAIAIAAADGQIIYMNTADEGLSKLGNTNQLTQFQKIQYQITSQNIDNTSFQLIYLTSKQDILQYQLLTFIFVFMISLSTVIFSYFFYRSRTNKIAKSVAAITDAFKRVEIGDLTTVSKVSGQREFVEISNALNEMIHKLNEYIIREYKASLSQREAEYMALQAQINPHFLYNTLNGFIGLNRMGEKKILEKSILQLTHLFQYICSDSTSTTVGAEIAFIKQYLDLQTLKYDDRLTFTIQADPDTLDVVIPKLLIQPLIENTIVHGMEPTDTPIQIQIMIGKVHTKPFGDYLLISIRDNGVGFDSSQIDQIRHLGIKNIQQRLEYCNCDNFFQIQSKPNEGTQCIILMRF